MNKHLEQLKAKVREHVRRKTEGVPKNLEIGSLVLLTGEAEDAYDNESYHYTDQLAMILWKDHGRIELKMFDYPSTHMVNYYNESNKIELLG